MSEDIKLSILVCGLYERMPDKTIPRSMRADWESAVLLRLNEQVKGKSVQLITLYDNRVWTVGQKRNRLLWMAEGEYFSFVDDDDEVAGDYVDTLLAAIEKARGADVLCFRQDCVRGDLGGRVERCQYSLTYDYASGVHPDGSMWWRGKPAHTMAWRTAVVQDDTMFPDGDFGEDVGWVQQACKIARTEYQIDRTLYTYRFDPERSRTRGK